MIAAAVAFLGVSLLSAPAVKKYESPIAVMPFKNLNQDKSTDWLEKGIAETMISDLKKSGSSATVVERGQVEKALQEIALQGREATSSEAAGVGKLLGAKTIVLGAYQQSGKQMRINARFVAVETGVVLETAKVTGSIEGVFALQDQIVDKLLGIAKPPAARPKRKTTTQAVEAYRLYAMSLDTATDAERVGLLKRSVAADPEFSYAAEELAALEKRMGEYAKVSEKRFDQHDLLLRKRLYAPEATAQERTQLAGTLLSSLFTGRRYYSLAEEARRIRELRVPPLQPGYDLSEQASLYEFLAYEALMRHDDMLRVGERHLQEHAGGPTYRVVEMKMTQVVQAKREAAARRAEFPALLESHEKKRAEIDPRAPAATTALSALDMDACTAARDVGDPRLAVEQCEKVVAKWKGNPDENAAMFVRLARWTIALNLAAAGDHARAREAAELLAKEEPAFFGSVGLRTTMTSWPVDAP